MIPTNQQEICTFMQIVRQNSLTNEVRKRKVFTNYRTEFTKECTLRWKDLDYHATKLGELLATAVGVCDVGIVGLLVHPENVCATAVALLACLHANVVLLPIREEKNLPAGEPFEQELYRVATVLNVRMILVDEWYRKRIQKSVLINKQHEQEMQMHRIFQNLGMLEIFEDYQELKFDKLLLQQPYKNIKNMRNICLAYVDSSNGVRISGISEALLFEQTTFLSDVFELEGGISLMSTLECSSIQGIVVNILLPIMCGAHAICISQATSDAARFIRRYNVGKPDYVLLRESDVVKFRRMWIDDRKQVQWSGLKGFIFQKENHDWRTQGSLIDIVAEYLGHPLRQLFFFATGTGDDDIRGNMVAAGSGAESWQPSKNALQELIKSRSAQVAVRNSASIATQEPVALQNDLCDSVFDPEKPSFKYRMFPNGKCAFVGTGYEGAMKISAAALNGLYSVSWDSNHNEKMREKSDLVQLFQNGGLEKFVNSRFYGIQWAIYSEGIFILSATESTLTLTKNDGIATRIPAQIIIDTMMLNYDMKNCYAIEHSARAIKFLFIVCEIEHDTEDSFCLQVIELIAKSFHVQSVLCLVVRQGTVPLLKNGLLHESQFKKMFFQGKLSIIKFLFDQNHPLIECEVNELKSAVSQFKLPQTLLHDNDEILSSFIERDCTGSRSQISIISLLPETLQINPHAVFCQWVRETNCPLDEFLSGKSVTRYKAVETLTMLKVEQRINKTIHILEHLDIVDSNVERIMIIGDKTSYFYTSLYACMCIGLDVGIMPVYSKDYAKFAAILGQTFAKFKFTRIIVCNATVKRFLANDQLQAQLAIASTKLAKCCAEALLIDGELFHKIDYKKCINYLCPEKNRHAGDGKRVLSTVGKAEGKLFQVHVAPTDTVTVYACTQSELYDYCGVLLKNCPELDIQKCIVSHPNCNGGYEGTLMLMDIFMGIFQSVPVIRGVDDNGKKDVNGPRSANDNHSRMLVRYLKLIAHYKSKVVFLPSDLVRQAIPFIKPDYREFSLNNVAQFLLLTSTRPIEGLREHVGQAFLCNNLKSSCIQEYFECPYYPGGMITQVSQMFNTNLVLDSDRLSYGVLTVSDGDARNDAITTPHVKLACLGKLVEGLCAEIEPCNGWSTSAKATVGKLVFHSNTTTYKTDCIGFMLRKNQWNYPYVYLLGTVQDLVQYQGRAWNADDVETRLENYFTALIPGRVYFITAHKSNSNYKQEQLILGAEVANERTASAVAPAIMFWFWEQYNQCLDSLVLLRPNSIASHSVFESGNQKLVNEFSQSTASMRHEFKRRYEMDLLSGVLLNF